MIKLPFNNGKTALAVAGFVALCILAWATSCHDAKAEGVAVSAGSAIIRGPTPVFDVEWQWPKWENRDARWETGITMMGPSTYKGQPQQNTFAWSATFVDGFGPVDLGIGPAYLQNTDAYNHEGANFHLMLGYHYGPWFIRYNHFSNAGSKSPNLGRDLIMIGRTM